MFNLKSTLSWASVSMRSLTAMTRAWVNSWGDSVLGRQRQRIWVKMVKSLGSYQDVYELGFTSQWLISLFLSSYHWLCPMKRWYPHIFAYTYYGYLWISMDIYGYRPMNPHETQWNLGEFRPGWYLFGLGGLTARFSVASWGWQHEKNIK